MEDHEILLLLKPKIKKVLRQSHQNNAEDLEQELSLLIVESLDKKKFDYIPTFFELLEKEDTIKVNC